MRFVRLLGATILIYGFSYMRHAVTQMHLFFTHAPNADSRYILLNLNLGIVTFILDSLAFPRLVLEVNPAGD